MVNTQQQVNYPASSPEQSASLHPSVLIVAREIYTSYCKTHTEDPRRPVGAVIGRNNHRGQLVFKGKPILLPHECFVPFEEIAAAEAETHSNQ